MSDKSEAAPSLKRARKVYYGHYSRSRKFHPVIRLGGNYLSEFDFSIGDRIEVAIEAGIILITKVPSGAIDEKTKPEK